MTKNIIIIFLILPILSFFCVSIIEANCQYGTCNRDFYEICTVNGQQGIRYCVISNCCDNSDRTCPYPQNRSQCPNGNASCTACRILNEPTPTPYPNCNITNGGNFGYCTNEGGIGFDTHCNARCNVGLFPYTQNQDNMKCHFVSCSCGNTTWCCQPSPEQTPTPTSPPGQPQPTSPPPPTPTNTPTPTPTPTNTPTPTPTYIPVTLPTYRPGQTNPLNIVRPAQAWYCLKSEYYNGSITPGGKNNHRLTLTGEGFPPGARVYIIGCIATTGNINKCTTGQNNLDQLLLIEKSAGHEFIVDGANPITVGEDGRINKIVYSHSQESTIHSFYGVFLLGTGRGDDASSLQYATFASRQDVTRCTAVRWDPYGRVFDSQSLEPLPNVNILLTDEKKQKVNLPGLINPQKTNEAGIFNFMVEEGSYYLNPTPPKGYQFTNNPKINPNYYLAYSNIYKPNDLIIEEGGKPEHRDIPLDPGNNPPFETEVKSITFAVLPVKNGRQTKIVGQVSHPLTIISLKQKNKEIAKTTADKMGYYEIIIENKDITPGQPIVPYFTKFSLVKNNAQTENKNFFQRILSSFLAIFQKRTKASNLTLGLPIDPLPYFLEGYLEPNSIINIRLSSNNEVYYQTRTDQNGYLSIKPENLPNFNYYLEIISNNHPPTILSISDFINRNKKYLEEKGINLYRN